MKESLIQRAIVEYLAAVLPASYRCFAIPNGARRTASGRASNAVPGLTKGIPDLAVVGFGKCFFIEVKGPRGVVSDEQQEFFGWCAVKGLMPFCVACSVDDVKIALTAWKIPTRESRA